MLAKDLRPDFDTILVAGKPPPSEGELRDADVPVREVSLVRPVSPYRDLMALLALRKVVAGAQPRLIHTHMAKAGALARAAALSLPARPKLVHTYHGHVFDGYFGSKSEKTFLKIERALARRTDILIAISPEVRGSLLALGIGREEQYRTIPLGFDLSGHLGVSGPRGAFRSLLQIPEEAPLIGNVGRLVPIKDLRTLLSAMVHVPDAHLAVLGDGELRQDLELFARSLGLAHRVHFTGWVTNVAEAMSDMDLVVLSSLNEGTPVSLIEAAACGKAVAATDVGGVRYVVDDGITGLLSPPRDPDALAARIRTLLSDGDLRERMGRAGRARARRLFHKDRLLADVRNLYQELIARQ